jgi:phage terminase large subunit-like protein
MSISRRPRAKPPQDPATAWAKAVVAGKIVAGELVRHAAERHLRDMRDGPKRGLFWRPERATHALDFFPAVLTITEGAKVGEPFSLLPWHVFVVGSLFGWRTAGGRMRFRSGWLETGKGQAKSPLMAAIGLYMMGWYGISRARAYAIGQDRNTANVLFKDAVAMCRATIPGQDDGDSLESRGEVLIRGEFDNAWKIERPADNGQNSIFQSLANGEAISGPRPTLVAADEIHEFKSASPIETWKEAIAKMPGDALMLLGTNTPAVNQIVGTSYSEFYQRVARGDFSDDEAFAFIARTDPADHETVFENEACWAKALPALGITFPIENIRGRVNTAKALISTALSVKRLYFGIPVGSAEYWISEPAWRAVQKPVDAKALKGKPCWLSLDLSKKNDLTALTATWRGDDGHIWSKTWYWTARVGLEERAVRDIAPYLEYVEQGLLAAVPGPVIDYSFVVARVAELVAEHDIKALAFDAAYIAEFQAACADAGFPVWVWISKDEPAGTGLMLIRHAQGKRVSLGDKALTEIQLCMPHSITKLEDAILHEQITIDASKVTDLCSMNAAIDEDGQGNRCFAKERSRGRIDGLVTIAMGVGASDAGPLGATGSYLETDELILV